MNIINIYKNREIKLDKPVYIYRNLNRKGIIYSILQNGLVVGHAENLNLKDCKFMVNTKLRDKIREKGNKIVHAFIKGNISRKNVQSNNKIFYNPKIVDYFIEVKTNSKITDAREVLCSNQGVFANQ